MTYTPIPSSGGATLTTLTGLTDKQIVFGSATGTGTSSADLLYDDTTNDVTVSASESGGTVGITLANTSNTASSAVQMLCQVAGATAANPVYQSAVSGVTTWTWGLDNANSDRWALNPSASLGTSDAIIVNTDGTVGIGGAPTAGIGLRVAGSGNVRIYSESSSSANESEVSVLSGAGRQARIIGYGSGTGGNTGYGEAKADLFALELFNYNRIAFAVNTTLHAIIDVNVPGMSVIPTGTTRARVPGVLKTVQSDTGNVGAGEDTLHTYTLPASGLNADGQAVEIETMVTFAANANSKRVKVHFGATAVYDSTAQAQNGGALVVRARIVRTGATTQRASAIAVGDAATALFADAAQYTTPGETLSGTVVVKVTGEGVADNDIVNAMTVISWTPANN